MSFFYDLNKRMAALANKQDAKQIAEETKTSAIAAAPKSKLGQALTESEKWIQKAVNPKTKGNLHKALHVAQGETIPKAKIAKATHSKNPKLRHMAQFAKNVANEEMADEGNAFTGKLASTPKGGKFKVGNKEFKDTSSIEEGTCPSCNCAPCKCNEGNAFTGKLKATAKGSKFKLGNKEFKDTSSIEEGFKEMDAWLASREKEKGTDKFDVKDTGYSKRYTRKTEEPKDDDEEVSTEPKHRGRPKGKDKGPERTTKGAWKHKGDRKSKVKENDISITDRGEYDDEAGMAKDSLHTIVRHAKELESALHNNENMPEWVQEKIGQIKGMMSSVTDYILSTHERDIEQHTGEEGVTVVPEVAPPGAKAERMVKGIKKSLSKDGHLSAKDKAIAYATTWKAKKAGKVEEESTAEKDDKAERASKKVTKDIEYDEGHKGKDDANAEKAGKKVTKDIEYDDKKDKEEKVDETTTSGSVATATTSGKSSNGSMQFGKGVYESFNSSVEKMITESIDVTETVTEHEQEGKTITVTASGAEADMLMQLLKMAGLSGQGQDQGCGCGNTPCSCEEVDEAYGDTDETLNNPDWPTNTEKSDNAFQYSGGLNGPKSTGQSTTVGGGIPNLQARRQVSMEENVKLERSLFKTWKNYKG